MDVGDLCQQTGQRVIVSVPVEGVPEWHNVAFRRFSIWETKDVMYPTPGKPLVIHGEDGWQPGNRSQVQSRDSVLAHSLHYALCLFLTALAKSPINAADDEIAHQQFYDQPRQVGREAIVIALSITGLDMGAQERNGEDAQAADAVT
ncbi:hypothetical protein KSX_60510 [Ktedonospora formicarum]|uniref:Uncharacterized protein n=1 Tax=Ktedonospora formicarum TaxID=2778364 RepID=A0A8J3I6A3_9CHLR|nr:hypothetical protein KSX_60510 [Ktedonospora formicarum]